MSKTLRSIRKTMSTMFITDHSHNFWSSKHKVLLFVLQQVYFTAWKFMAARVSLQFNTLIIYKNQSPCQILSSSPFNLESYGFES